MEAVYKLKATEINTEFIKAVRKMFKDKFITITITADQDETAYLTSVPANEKILTESMAQEPAVRFTPEEFKKMVDKADYGGTQTYLPHH